MHREPSIGKTRTTTHWIMTFFIGLTLSACGGGGGSDSPSSPQTSAEADQAGLSFVQASIGGADYDLVAIPPSSPGGAVNVSGGGGISQAMKPITLVKGNVAEGAIDSIRKEMVIYAQEDGQLWRVSAGENPFPPSSSKISNANSARFSCWNSFPEQPVVSSSESLKSTLPSQYFPYLDLTNIDNTPVVFATKTIGSNDCDANNDMEWTYLRVGDGETLQPHSFPEPDVDSLDNVPLVALRTALGGYQGWLIKKDGDLVRLNEEAQVSTVVEENVGAFSSLGVREDGSLYLVVDKNLYFYDPADDSLNALSFEFKENRSDGLFHPANSISDGHFLFFIEHHVGADPATNTDDKIALYRASPDGVTTYMGEENSPYTNATYTMVLTQDHIVWHVNTSGSSGASLVAYEKTDPATSETLHTGSGSSTLFGVTDPGGEWIFFNSDSGATAIRVRDGEERTFPLRLWLTGTLSRQREPGFFRVVSSMVLASAAPASEFISLKTIPTRTLDDATTYSDLGTISLGTEDRAGSAFVPYGYGGGRFSLLYVDQSESYHNIYWQAGKTGSLQDLALPDAFFGIPVPAH